MAIDAVPDSVRDMIVDARRRADRRIGRGLRDRRCLARAVGRVARRDGPDDRAQRDLRQEGDARRGFSGRLIAIGVTLGVAVLIVLALGLLVVGPYVGHLLADRFGLGDAFDIAWSIGRWVGAGLLVMFVWAVLYKFLANTDAPFRVFTPGAIVGVLAWLGISALFGVYLGALQSATKRRTAHSVARSSS